MTSSSKQALALVLLIGLFLAACIPGGGVAQESAATPTPPVASPTPLPQPSPEPTMPAGDPLDGSRWSLAQGPGAATPLPGTEISLDFETGRLSGHTGCNSYGADYTVAGNGLTVGVMMQTLADCQGLMEQEAAYLAALGQATAFRLEEGKLTLSGPGGDLLFTPAVDLSLEGTTWVLAGIAQEGGIVSTAVDASIYAEFSQGQVSGSSGCNRYSGSYERGEGTLRFGPLAGTRRACDETRGQREFTFLSALGQVAGYTIERQVLSLADGSGKLLLQFQAGTPEPTP